MRVVPEARSVGELDRVGNELPEASVATDDLLGGNVVSASRDASLHARDRERFGNHENVQRDVIAGGPRVIDEREFRWM
jgi:hypothetical protein